LSHLADSTGLGGPTRIARLAFWGPFRPLFFVLIGCLSPLSCSSASSAATGHARMPPPNLAKAPPFFWDQTLNVRAGFGYKDNLTLGPFDPEGSAFATAGFDLVLMRLSATGSELTLLLFADDWRYLDAESVDKENLVVAQARWKQPINPEWRHEGVFEYFHMNQVFDASITETNRSSVKAKGHLARWRPGFRRDWSTNTHVDLQFGLGRQYYQEPLDDYWEMGPRIAWEHRWSNRQALTLSYEYLYRPYDRRMATTSDGMSIPGTSLSFRQQEIVALWRMSWGQNGRWTSTSRAGIEINQDNGAEYFDYLDYQASQQLRLRLRPWEMRAKIGWHYYDFEKQTADLSGLERRTRTAVDWNVRIERQWGSRTTLFVDYEQEHSLGSASYDQYRVRVLTGGLELEF